MRHLASHCENYLTYYTTLQKANPLHHGICRSAGDLLLVWVSDTFTHKHLFPKAGCRTLRGLSLTYSLRMHLICIVVMACQI